MPANPLPSTARVTYGAAGAYYVQIYNISVSQRVREGKPEFFSFFFLEAQHYVAPPPVFAPHFRLNSSISSRYGAVLYSSISGVH